MAQKKRLMLVGTKAKAKAFAGANYLADAVKLTLGPYGRNFASGIRGGPIAISNDGVSLAKEIEGLDEFEDLGVRAVREAATKTNDTVGDGTTTAMVLVQSILAATGFDPDVIVPKLSPVEISEIIRKESEMVVEKLDALKVDITSREQLIAVAKVSVENAELAELVGGAQWDVGADGTVLAEEHNLPHDEVEMVNGIRWDNGFSSSRFINNQEKQSLELVKVHVIVTNKVFNGPKSIDEMKDLFGKLIEKGSTHVVIMGRAFDDGAIGLCVKNMQLHAEGKGGYPMYPVNAPYTDQDNVMEDIAAALGARYINTTERNLATLQPTDVGFAEKMTIKRFEGIVIGKKKGEDEHVDGLVNKRLFDICEKLKGDVSPFEKRMLLGRQSQLKSGTAIVKVGADTEQERRYKKDKVDDAVNAVKAAIQDGVVPGGGMALMLAADDMPEGSLITEALRAPYKQIQANAGKTFEIPAHIQDPLRVVRTAFQKASSIARSLSTTEILVNWEREKPQVVLQNPNPNDDETD